MINSVMVEGAEERAIEKDNINTFSTITKIFTYKNNLTDHI